MSLDFFNNSCAESARNESLFGICDPQDGSVAYTDSDNPESWIARVVNDGNIELVFTAIDHCLVFLKEGSSEQESTCDGMITYENGIYLVELKNRRTGGWLPEAISQLKNTIRLLQDKNEKVDLRFKKAFACNKKHPHFTTIDSESSKRFFSETNGFRLDVNAEIIIKNV